MKFIILSYKERNALENALIAWRRMLYKRYGFYEEPQTINTRNRHQNIIYFGS